MRFFLLIFPILWRPALAVFILTLSLCSSTTTLFGQDVIFLNGGSAGPHDFQDPGNWNNTVIPGDPPNFGNVIKINITTNVTIENINNSIQFKSLQITGSGTLTLRFAGPTDAQLFLGEDAGQSDAFTIAAGVTVVLGGDIGATIVLPSSNDGFPNVATISGTLKLAPTDPNILFRLLVQDEDVATPFLNHGFWYFEAGSRLEIGGGALDDNYADSYPFSGATLIPYGGRVATTDTRNDTHIFQSGSTLAQYDGLDPFGNVNLSINKCVFETGSTFDFADSKPQSGAAHRPNFTRRTYSNYRFSSTIDKSYNETVATLFGTSTPDSCVTDDFEIVSNRLTFANRGSFSITIKGDLKLPTGAGFGSTFLSFDPPAATGPPLSLPAGFVQLFFENTTPKAITGESRIFYLARNSDFPIEIRPGSTITCDAFIETNLVTPSHTGFILRGRLNMVGERYIFGTAGFSMTDGSILSVSSADGINASPTTTGNIRTASNSFNNQEARYIYMGPTASQNTGTGLPSWSGSLRGVVLEIDKPNATDVVIFNRTDAIYHQIVLTRGRFNADNRTIGIQARASARGAFNITASANFIAGTGTVSLQGGVDITDAVGLNFYNVDITTTTGILTGVNFGLGTQRPTVQNQLRIIGNLTATISANPPLYATGSTLIYRRDGLYSAGLEWTTGSSSASTPGVPHHVQIGQQGQNDTRITISGDRQCLGNLVVGDPAGGTGYRLLNNNAADILRIGGNLVRNASSTQANSFIANSLVVFNGSTEQLITDLSTAARGMALPRVEINNPAGVKLNSSALTVVIMSGSSGNVLRMLNGNLDLNGGYVTMITNNGTLIAEGGIRRITNTHATQQGQFTINAADKVFSAASGGSWVFDKGPSKGVTLISRNGAFNFGLVSGSPIVTINDSLVILHSSGFTNSPFYGPQSTIVYANPGSRNTGSIGTLTEWQPVPGVPVGAGQPVNVQLGLGFGYPHLSGFNLALEGSTTTGTPTLTITNNTTRRVSGNITLGHGTGGGTHTLALGTGSPSTTVLQVGGNWLRYNNSTLAHLNRPVTFDGSTDQTITAFGGGTQAFGILDVNKTGGELQLVAGTTIDLQATTASATPSLPALLNMRAGNLNLNGGTCALSGSLASGVQVTGARSITSSVAGGQFNFIAGAATRTVLPTPPAGNTLTFGTNVLVNLNTGANFGNGTTTVQGELRLNNGGSVATNPPIYAANSILSYNFGGAVTTGTEWAPNNAIALSPGVPHHVHIGKGAGTFTTTVSSPTPGGFRYLNGDLVIGDGTTAYTLQIETTNSPELRIGGNWLRNTNGTFTHNNRLVTFSGTTNQTITVAGGGTETYGLLQVNKTAGELRLSSSPATNVSVAATAGTALLQMNNVGALNLQGQTLSIAGTVANSGIAVAGAGVKSIVSSPGTGFVNFSNAAANREITSSGGGTLTFGSGVAVNLNTAVNFGSSISTIQGQLRMNSGGSVTANPPFYDNNSFLIYNTTATANPATEWQASTESTSAFGVPHHVQVGLTAGGNNSKAEITTDYRFLKGDMIIGDGSSATGYELILSGSGVLRVGGNWLRNTNGTFTRGTRQVVFRSATNATITAPGGEIFHDLGIDKAAAANTVTLNNVVEVANNLTLTEGRFISDPTNYLHVTNPALAAITGGDATSYVQGPLRRRTNNIAGIGNQMSFPVGEFSGGTHYYKPVWLQDVAGSNGTTTSYQANYVRANAPRGTPNYFFSGFIQGILQNQYWRFESLNATAGDGILVLNYEDPLSGNPFMDINGSNLNPIGTQDEVGMVRKSNNNPSVGGTYETTNPSGTLNLSSTPPEARVHTVNGQIASHPGTVFNNHLFFTLGWALNKLLILPIQLLSFEASLQPGNSSLLSWQIADDKDLQQFEVEVSRDGQRYTKLVSMGRNGTQYTYRHTGLQSGVYYYRLHILGKDGSRAYSKVQMVQVGVNVTVIQGLLQNPVQGGRALVKVYSAAQQDAFATVVDNAGRVLLRQKIVLAKGNNQAPLSVLPLMPGMYRLQLQTADGVQLTMPFVK